MLLLQARIGRDARRHDASQMDGTCCVLLRSHTATPTSPTHPPHFSVCCAPTRNTLLLVYVAIPRHVHVCSNWHQQQQLDWSCAVQSTYIAGYPLEPHNDAQNLIHVAAQAQQAPDQVQTAATWDVAAITTAASSACNAVLPVSTTCNRDVRCQLGTPACRMTGQSHTASEAG